MSSIDHNNHVYIKLNGNPYSIGEELGKRFQQQIVSYVENRWQKLTNYHTAEELLYFAAESLEIARGETPFSFDECRGAAAGARIDFRKLYLVTGMTDTLDWVSKNSNEVREIDSSCTSCIIGNSKKNKTMLLQTWDMPEDVFPYIIILDKSYHSNNRIITMTLMFGLSHLGFSDKGFGIGTNNLGDACARSGVVFPFLINEGLCTKSLHSAVELINKSTRMSAHNYAFIDKFEAMFVEASAQETGEIELSDENNKSIHTNHYVLEALKKYETNPSPTSKIRFLRLKEAIKHQYDLSPNEMKRLLSIHPDICRHNPNGIGTVGAMLIDSQERGVYFIVGKPCEHEWKKYFIN